ncbi:MAG: trehalase family glycosidase [Armatimonadota bacterium]|nr:trehalase family glycosidase [Armatimonadota bacterium]
MDNRAEALGKRQYVEALSLRNDEVEEFMPRRFVIGSRLFIRHKGSNADFDRQGEEITPTTHEWGLGSVSYRNGSVQRGQDTRPAEITVRDGGGTYRRPEGKPIRESWSPAGYRSEWRLDGGLTLREEISLRRDVLVDVISFSNPTGRKQSVSVAVTGLAPLGKGLSRADLKWQVSWDGKTRRLHIDEEKVYAKYHDAARLSAQLLAIRGGFAVGVPAFASSTDLLNAGQGRSEFSEETVDDQAVWAYRIPISGKLAPDETKKLVVAYTAYPTAQMASRAMPSALRYAERSYSLAEKEWNRYFAANAPRFKSDDAAYVKLYYWNLYADRANRIEYIGHATIKLPIVLDDKIRYTNFQCTGCYGRRLQMERWLRDDTCRNGLEVLLGSQRTDGNCGIVVDDPGAEGGMLTEMPILAAAVWADFEVTWDSEFLRRALPALIRYDDFFRKHRDSDNDGLIEVLGMGEIGTYDDSPRCYEMGASHWFDWGFANQPAEPVDVNSVIYLQRKLIARMARLLGEDRIANEFEKRAARLKRQMDKVMWDDERRLYSDVYGPNHVRVRAKTPAIFVPLRTGLPDAGRAKELIDGHLLNPKEFWGENPLPTLSYDDPQYDPSVRLACAARGETSLDLVWDVIEGLAGYGEDKPAAQLTDRAVRLMVRSGIPTSGERYAPNGRPIGGYIYGWSNLINDAIITRVLGVRADPESETITFAPDPPSGMSRFSLTGVKIGGGEFSFSCQRRAGGEFLTVSCRRGPSRKLRLNGRELLLSAGDKASVRR